MRHHTRHAAEPGAPHTRRRRKSLLVASACSAVLVLAAALSGGGVLRSTLASWSDEENVSSTFEAKTVPPPVLTQPCQFRPGLIGIGARVRIFWQLPEGYELGDVEVEASTAGLGSVLAPLTGFSLTSNTTATGDGTYRTDVPTNLLGGLLGLGTELEIAFVVEDENGWVSEPAAVASNAGLIIGLGGSCRNLT